MAVHPALFKQDLLNTDMRQDVDTGYADCDFYGGFSRKINGYSKIIIGNFLGI
ncbi:hypothetical protein RvVAT039_19940 [Agrobacterium vitis]|nr:hypothetical protein RvVAR0630_00240 [Agrobacterium vitis]BCH64778.1 hypothetical protein RvVAT039_19940 [Agrobacterium vitis]